MKPICLISMSLEEGEHYRRNFLNQNYQDYFSELGFSPIAVANSARDMKDLVERLSPALTILSGGNDVAARTAGASAAGDPPLSLLRDEAERSLVDASLAASVPVLGICRGMQFLNCYFGGSLTQPLAAGAREAHRGRGHELQVTDEAMAELLGTKRLSTNSFHEHGVHRSQLAPGLVCVAEDIEHSIVEAFRHEKLPVLGVQWHPERPGATRENDEILIRWLSRKRSPDA